ncbi:MAG: hypothetical protein Q7S22_00685 [Candidatus Micrarchaeota archaeon]|nr:hypothetical protein [Candidatus Micrarchaeota archaeon]
MKGYLSFILIFVAMLAVLSAFAIYTQVNERNMSKVIAVEITDDAALQQKQLIFEATSRGIRNALEISVATGETDVIVIEKVIKLSVHEQIKPLADYDSDNIQVITWCGYVNNQVIKNLKERIVTEKKALICDGCSKLDNSVCSEFISVDKDFSISFQSPSLDYVNFGIIGISTYNKKYGIASVSYIPTSASVSVIK